MNVHQLIVQSLYLALLYFSCADDSVLILSLSRCLTLKVSNL